MCLFGYELVEMEPQEIETCLPHIHDLGFRRV